MTFLQFLFMSLNKNDNSDSIIYPINNDFPDNVLDSNMYYYILFVLWWKVVILTVASGFEH